MIHKFFTLCFALMVSGWTLFAYAYGSTKIGNLYYHLDYSTKTAELTNEYANYSHSLTNIIIPATVKYSNVTYTVIGIGDQTFFGCDWVTSITIPNTIASIGASAFCYCSSLTSLTIPSSVTSIGSSAFSNCTGITSLTIPSSVTTIGSSAFERVNNVIYEGTATGSPWSAKCVNGYVEEGLVYLDNTKTTLVGCSSSAVGDILIPNSVTGIGVYAFYGCSHLTSMTISNGVENIGKMSFYNCSGLTEVSIGSNVTTIGERAFDGCTGLTSLVVPDNVTNIGSNAFWYVNNIIHSGTEKWGAKCANGYVEDWFVYGDNTKTTLLGCSSTATGEITFPNSVTTIGNNAFRNCINITSVIIPNGVTYIGGGYTDSYTFYGCSNLQSITIPNSVTRIGTHSFDRCSNLKLIIFDADYIMSHTSFSASSGFRYIFGEQIEECVFGENVTRIGSYTFYSCSNLRSVIIPAGATRIGDYVFYSCNRLTSITNNATTPQTCYSNDFTNVDKSACTLYVPKESIELYQAADGWKDFTNIVKIPVPTWSVTFVDYDESILSQQQVEEGEDAVAPSDPYRAGYTFTGWDKDFNSITEDLTITAQYELGEDQNFTIYFNDKEGDEILSSDVVLKVPAAPEISGFTFLGWRPVANIITLNAIEIEAVYQSNIPTSTPPVYNNPANPAQKLIRDGNVYILRGDKTYTLQGQEVK